MEQKVEAIENPEGMLYGEKGAYAYIIKPFDYLSFKSIHRLLNKGVIVQVLNETHTDGERMYPRGSLLVPMGVQPSKKELIEETIDMITSEDGIDVFALTTGLAVSGVDLGSRSNSIIKAPKVAVLVDGGVSSYEAGEVWHLLDQRYEMNVTLLPVQRLRNADLSRYNRIVLVNGNYASIMSLALKI